MAKFIHGWFKQKIHFLKEEIILTSIKNPTEVLKKNEVYNYGAPVFAPDYSTTVLAAKIVLTLMSILYILDLYGLVTLLCLGHVARLTLP